MSKRKCTVTEGISRYNLAAVYGDDYITERVGDDFFPPKPVKHPMVKYLSAWVDGVFSGAFMFVFQTPIDVEAHALLKRGAVKYSRELGKAAQEWVFGDERVQRLSAAVPEGLETARNYALRMGFVEEGRKRMAHQRNGEVRDIYMLGMTREDWRRQWA